MENKQVLFSSPLLRIEKVCCLRARRGLSCEECKTEHQITIPLSGVNVREVNGKSYTISPLHATLSNRGEEYRVGHPYGSGEIQVNFVLQEALLLALLCAKAPSTENRPEKPFIKAQVPLAFNLHLAAHLLMATTRLRSSSALEMEEITIAFIERLFDTVGGNANISVASIRDLELAQRAQTLLASCYSQSITLHDVASNLGTSVYHLCRVFRRATNSTLWAQVQRLRARAALTHLANGEHDLTALGLSLGYSHHSHFSAAFHREIGLTPSTARRILDKGSLSQVRELLAY